MVETPFPKLKLTVNKVGGQCYHNYNLGDVLILEDFTHPRNIFVLAWPMCFFRRSMP